MHTTKKILLRLTDSETGLGNVVLLAAAILAAFGFLSMVAGCDVQQEGFYGVVPPGTYVRTGAEPARDTAETAAPADAPVDKLPVADAPTDVKPETGPEAQPGACTDDSQCGQCGNCREGRCQDKRDGDYCAGNVFSCDNRLCNVVWCTCKAGKPRQNTEDCCASGRAPQKCGVSPGGVVQCVNR